VRKICLALPTNRPCSDTITALHEEAEYAAANFEVEVHLLVLDSSDDRSRAEHRRAVDRLSQTPNVVVHLLDEEEQRAFLDRTIRAAGLADAPHLLDLMLPSGVSYGACTNRIFLIAAALGCESVHRRDSDSRYQATAQGRPVYPVHHEVSWIGRRAAEIADAVTESILEPEYADRTVSLVGASFVGELSVDIGEIESLDQDVYREVVSLWAPMSWSDDQKYELVSESFRGAGVVTGPFAEDHATLCLVDPMRIDMCNIAFHRDAFERVPLLPALDTIGSDYFLMHAIYDGGLPGVLHNRDIVNFYTAERRTDAGFAAYQLRFAKFFLSMLYLNFIYERMGEAKSSLLDGHGLLDSAAIAALARQSALLDQSENHWRLDVIDRSYRKLGGRYADFADALQERGAELLDRAQADIEDFALLTEAWQPLVRASSESAGSLPLPRKPERSFTS
jgi:hypothetical protein